jgi:hypothetical protein
VFDRLCEIAPDRLTLPRCPIFRAARASQIRPALAQAAADDIKVRLYAAGVTYCFAEKLHDPERVG